MTRRAHGIASVRATATALNEGDASSRRVVARRIQTTPFSARRPRGIFTSLGCEAVRCGLGSPEVFDLK
jgi:hypothetical protein